MSEKETGSPTKELTLAPLPSHGPDALDTHDIPKLEQARLCEVQFRFQNTEHGVRIKKAPDLFARNGSDTELFPAGTTLTQATFDLQFADAPNPHKVTIHPPEDLTLEFPSDEQRINPWLEKRGFRIPKQILRTAFAFLLAIASAVAPALDDDDGDDDDVSTERRALCA